MYRSSPIFQTIFLLCLTIFACDTDKNAPKGDKGGETSQQKDSVVEKVKSVKVEKTAKIAPISGEMRIVSTAPSTTEFLFELGLGPKIVGVSKFCNFPKDVEKIPKVGGHTDPDLETIIALKPTIVVGVDSSRRKKTEDILTKANIKSLWVKVETVEDVLNVPETLAVPFSIKSTENLSGRMRAGLEPVLVKKGQTRPKVLVVFGLAPMIVAGPGTYVDELVMRAGGQNIMASGPAYPQLDNEKLIALNPELIIDVSYGKHDPLPAQLSAVKNKRVIKLENLDLMRPSPRIGDMFTFLKNAIGKVSK